VSGLRVVHRDVPFAAQAPGEHDRRSLRMLAYRLRVFDLALAELGPADGRRYVDLGAGALPFARRAQGAGWGVTAVDARTPWLGEVPAGMAHVQADVRGFDLGGFDAVGIVGLLYHLPLADQVALLRRCAGRPTVIDTEVYSPEAVPVGPHSARLGPAEVREGWRGGAFAEDGRHWSSAGDAESFWLDEASLLALCAACGWGEAVLFGPAYASLFGLRRFLVLR
jgi:hypothetical protein